MKVLVNGFQTKNIQIQKGVRQGDPLSLYLFLLAMELLVATINRNQNIEGLGKGHRLNIKCPSYADDLTLTLFCSYSVALAFKIIQNFTKATGLKLNIKKTQGMVVSSSCNNALLLSITWKNDSITILGLKIGKLNPKIIWNNDLENLKRQKLSITVPFQTFQAKSLLAKAKLLSQITCTARTYPLDTRTQQIIETEFVNYLTNNSAIQLCMKNLQRPTIAGGIKYPNPTIYCNLFYTSHLFEYFKARKRDLPFNANTYLIEYEIGFVLSKTYNLKKLNHLPHRDNLTPSYEQSIRILTKYKITLEELQTGKSNQFTNNYPFPINWSDHDKIRWKLTFNDILPNYLKTFNYRIVWNLLPFSHELGKCALCRRGQDSTVHLFAKCRVTQQIWKLLKDVVTNITRKQFTIDPLTPINFCFPIQLIMYLKTVAPLVTATNYCIWQTRVGQLNATPQDHNSKPVNHRIVLAKIFMHISNREKKERQRIDQTFIDTI